MKVQLISQAESFAVTMPPVTTRPDVEDFHGYGMKSMRAIARKYGGRLKAKAEDGVFNLTVWLVNREVRPAAKPASS